MRRKKKMKLGVVAFAVLEFLLEEPPPWVLGADTYGSVAAAEYFRAVDDVMARDFQAAARCVFSC